MPSGSSHVDNVFHRPQVLSLAREVLTADKATVASSITVATRDILPWCTRGLRVGTAGGSCAVDRWNTSLNGKRPHLRRFLRQGTSVSNVQGEGEISGGQHGSGARGGKRGSISSEINHPDGAIRAHVELCSTVHVLATERPWPAWPVVIFVGGPQRQNEDWGDPETYEPVRAGRRREYSQG